MEVIFTRSRDPKRHPTAPSKLWSYTLTLRIRWKILQIRLDKDANDGMLQILNLNF